MYLVIFDKSGRSLSGWHYGKLRALGTRWIQRSAIGADHVGVAMELLRTLREFGAQKIPVFEAADITDSAGAPCGST
ncbi:MAG: hypothetical protein H5T49_01190 [Hadesarchaea archaeon]|nr:hypothetical protein [Hadesarchaea archaeon]